MVEADTRNTRRFWFVELTRVTVLIGVDVATFLVVRSILEAVRIQPQGGNPVALGDWLFPPGFLAGWSLLVALILGLVISGAYGSGELRRDTGRIFAGVLLAALITLYPLVWTTGLGVVSDYLAAVLLFGLSLKTARWGADRLVSRFGPILGGNRVIVVGNPADSEQMKLEPLRWRRGPMKVVGWVPGPSAESRDGEPSIGDLGVLIHEHRADMVVVRESLAGADFSMVVDVALASGCHLLASSRATRVAGVEPRATWLHGAPFVELTPPHFRRWELVLKRGIDLVGSITGLLVAGPLMLAIAVWVRRSSRGPTFFAQERMGVRGRTFMCYKFRSMQEDAEEVLKADPELYADYLANQCKVPSDRDPRLTPTGRFLRRASLDELPQLFNVLMGHMSLVGPRPITLEELDHYGPRALQFLALKPGITGNWAVQGRSEVGYPDRARMELEYVRNWSLLGDLRILLRTLPAVIKKRGAH